MSANPIADLAIIGGGLAGASAALAAARRGSDVLLFDRGDYPRDKVCGEFLSPEALPLLEAILPAALAPAPFIRRARFIAASGACADFPLPAPARGLSRLVLDAALWRAAAAAGARLLPRAPVTAIHSRPGRHVLDTPVGSFAARAVIVAAGRWFHLPGLPSPTALRASNWIGVKARFSDLLPSSAVEMYLFPGGYCGLAPVENGPDAAPWTTACCLLRRDQAADLAVQDFVPWILAAARHPPLARRLEGGRQSTPTVVTAPVHLGPRLPAVGDVLLAGDASGFIDPFCGDGMARALLSGHLAAHALLDHGPRAAPVYAAQLQCAAASSYHFSRALRALIAAPAPLQSAALRALHLSRQGPRLFNQTRWRI